RPPAPGGHAGPAGLTYLHYRARSPFGGGAPAAGVDRITMQADERNLIQDRDNAEQRPSTRKPDQRAQAQGGLQRAPEGSPFSAQQLLMLQRAAGNRATAAALGRQAVQRAVGNEVDVE